MCNGSWWQRPKKNTPANVENCHQCPVWQVKSDYPSSFISYSPFTVQAVQKLFQQSINLGLILLKDYMCGTLWRRLKLFDSPKQSPACWFLPLAQCFYLQWHISPIGSSFVPFTMYRQQKQQLTFVFSFSSLTISSSVGNWYRQIPFAFTSDITFALNFDSSAFVIVSDFAIIGMMFTFSCNFFIATRSTDFRLFSLPQPPQMRLLPVSSWSNEVQANMNSRIMICVHWTLDLQFLLQVALILLIQELHNAVSTTNDHILRQTTTQ